jgi:hypothetical protein
MQLERNKKKTRSGGNYTITSEHVTLCKLAYRQQAYTRISRYTEDVRCGAPAGVHACTRPSISMYSCCRHNNQLLWFATCRWCVLVVHYDGLCYYHTAGAMA